jgi:hypothetical protein
MGGTPRAQIAEPNLPPTFAPAEPGDLDDYATLDGVAIGPGVDVGRTVRGLEVRESTLTGVRLPGATFDGIELLDVVFEDCDLSGTTFADATLRRVVFRRCRLSGVVAADLTGADVRVADCRADEIWLRASRLDRCEFADCDLTGSDWYGARIARTRIVRCQLDGAELSAIELDDVALHGSTLAGAHGIGGLRNVVIGPDQVLDVAVPVLATLGIRIDDDPAPDPPAGG